MRAPRASAEREPKRISPTFNLFGALGLTVSVVVSPTESARPWRSELSAILGLGVPMALTQLIQFAVNVIDVLMIGRLGAEPLAAASLGLVVFYAVLTIGFGTAMAVSPMVSQALGANRDDTESVRRSVRMAGVAVLVLVPPAMLVFASTEWIALALRQPESLARLARPYVLALGPSLPFMLGSLVLRNFLAALEKTRVPLLIVAATTVLNAGLNYLFIYGHFGMPRLELVGAGIASSLSHAAGFFVMALYVRWDTESARFAIFRGALSIDLARLVEVFRLAWPITVTMAFEAMLFNAAVFVMGRIGVNEVAAYQIALNVAAITFMIPLGLSMGGAVRVGLAAGAGDLPRVRRAAVLSVVVCAASILLVAVPVLITPEGIAGLYLDASKSDNSVVFGLVTRFLPIAAAFALFDATQVAANQCLRGLKDVRVPMVLTGLSYWAIGFPVATWLGLYTSVGAVGVWWGLLVSLVTAALLLGTRLAWLLGKGEPREIGMG